MSDCPRIYQKSKERRQKTTGSAAFLWWCLSDRREDCFWKHNGVTRTAVIILSPFLLLFAFWIYQPKLYCQKERRWLFPAGNPPLCIYLHKHTTDPWTWTAWVVFSILTLIKLYSLTGHKKNKLLTQPYSSNNYFTTEINWMTLVKMPVKMSNTSLRTCSVIVSSDDVASSYTRMGVSFKMARAMAILCFSPPVQNTLQWTLHYCEEPVTTTELTFFFFFTFSN